MFVRDVALLPALLSLTLNQDVYCSIWAFGYNLLSSSYRSTLFGEYLPAQFAFYGTSEFLSCT